MDSYIPSSVLRDRHANVHHATAPLQPQQKQQQQPKISTVTGNLCCPTSHSHQLQHQQQQHQYPIPLARHSSTQRQKTILIGQEYYSRTDEERFDGVLNSEDEADEREYQEAKRARKLKKELKRQVKELKKQKKKEKKRAKEDASMATKVATATAVSTGTPMGATATLKGLNLKTKNVAVAVGPNNSLKANSNPTSSSISYQHTGRAVKQWFRSRFSSYNDNRTTKATATATRLREGSELGTEQEQSHHRLLLEDEEEDEEEEEHAIDSGVGQEPERLWPKAIMPERVRTMTSPSSSTSVYISSCSRRILPFESVSASTPFSPDQKNIRTIVDSNIVSNSHQGKGRGLLLDSNPHTTIASPSFSSLSTSCSYDHNDDNGGNNYDPQGVDCSSSSCCFALDETQTPTKVRAKTVTPTTTATLRLPTPRQKGPQFCLRRVWSRIHDPRRPVESNHLHGVSTDINKHRHNNTSNNNTNYNNNGNNDNNSTSNNNDRVDKGQKKKDL